jgi:hypothetical protein
MRLKGRFWFVLLPLGVAACSTWSTTTVKPARADPVPQAAAPAPDVPAGIFLTENDITDRPYKVLGDLEVTVRKTTILNKDPTRADVDARLRKEATKLGADAVVLIRYGTVGIGMTSWGVLHGQGRAVKFQ